MLARPLAYAAAQGIAIPASSLHDLRGQHYDPAVDLWADFALAASTPADGEAAARLAQAAERDGPVRPFAQFLQHALQSTGNERTRQLDAATLWLPDHHPEAVKVWSGWRLESHRLVRIRPSTS
jgi:hypothetical protein